MIETLNQLIKILIEKNSSNTEEMVQEQDVYNLLFTILELNNKDIYLNKNLNDLILKLDKKITLNNVLKTLIKTIKQICLFYNTYENFNIDLQDNNKTLPITQDNSVLKDNKNEDFIIDFSQPGKHIITHFVEKENLEIKEIININEKLEITREYITKSLDNIDNHLNLYDYDFSEIINNL